MADEEKPKGKEGEAKEDGEDEKEKSSAKKKGILIGIIILVVLLVQIATAYFFVKMIKGESPSETAHEQMEADSSEAAEMMTRFGAILEEPMEITVNIAGQKGSHYLKSTIQLEWDEDEYPDLREILGARMVKIKDIIIDILSTQSMEDLRQISGKKRVKEAILSDINVILPDDIGRINKVLFEEFIIQ